MLTDYLLGWNIKRHCPEVHPLVRVYARDDKEDARSLSTSTPESAKSEDDSSLILLHHLDTETEGDGEGDQHHQQGQHGQQQGAAARTGCVSWNNH